MRAAAVLPPGFQRAVAGAGMPLVTDPGVLAGHGVDWTGRWSGPVLGLVRPRTTEQVARILALAAEHSLPVQVQGGNTGLVGGSVPDRPALVLATTGLDRLDQVDAAERTVVAGAGVPVAALAAHAAADGLRFGIDLAARDTATVGGLVATDAGGMSVCAYGTMREQVRGLTAVLADGRIVSTVGRPRKDSTGYDLGGLLVGSEGTLGVVTEVEVALHPAPAPSTMALLGADDLAGAVAAARAVQSGPAALLAAEVVDAAGIARAARALGQLDPLPAGAGWLVLLEVADGGTGEALAGVADQVVALATTARDRQRLWALRERQTELYAALPGGGPEKLDVSLRLDRLDAGVAAIRAAVQEASGQRTSGQRTSGQPGGARGTSGRVPADHRGPTAWAGLAASHDPWVGFFGHVLDGNLHVQLVGAPDGLAAHVLEVVADLGGSISAEHGIGRMKAGQLHLARSADEIAWMRQIRATADPAGLLNPGVLLGEA